ncbi:MAG: hypothetical protein L3J59_15675 [Methylococcaceae bacterium]|nr:hypothetical protein [Methylococcaceae bacterium]
MKIKVSGMPIGQPFESKKKTGYVQKFALIENGKLTSTHAVFSQSLASLRIDDKGMINVTVDLPEFVMVSR